MGQFKFLSTLLCTVGIFIKPHLMVMVFGYIFWCERPMSLQTVAYRDTALDNFRTLTSTHCSVLFPTAGFAFWDEGHLVLSEQSQPYINSYAFSWCYHESLQEHLRVLVEIHNNWLMTFKWTDFSSKALFVCLFLFFCLLETPSQQWEIPRNVLLLSL